MLLLFKKLLKRLLKAGNFLLKEVKFILTVTGIIVKNVAVTSIILKKKNLLIIVLFVEVNGLISLIMRIPMKILLIRLVMICVYVLTAGLNKNINMGSHVANKFVHIVKVL